MYRRIAAFGVAVIAAIALAGLSAAAPTVGADYRTTWKGSFWCKDRGYSFPLDGARVELWERGWEELPKFVDDTLVAVAQTDSDGSWQFSTRSDDEDDFYVRILLSGGGVRLEHWLEPWPSFVDTDTNENDVPLHDYGRQVIQADNGNGTPRCAVWQAARNAYADYRTITGGNPPFGDLEIQAEAPSAGVPFTFFSTIMWPAGAATGPMVGTRPTPLVVYHEFAHAVRHAFDGPFEHFALDVVNFAYPQQHQWCKETNEGFAFNEGWAQYWAIQSLPPTDAFPPRGRPPIAIKDLVRFLTQIYGADGNQVCQMPDRTDDYRVEGNVASALLLLDLRCTNYGPREMIKTLAVSPGRIHSYEEMERRLGELHGACRLAELSTPPAYAPTRLREPQPTPWKSQLGQARAQLSALDRIAAKARAGIADARRDAATPLPCTRKPCLPALAERFREPMLAGELAQAKRMRADLAFLTSRAEAKRIAALSPVAYGRWLIEKQRTIQGHAARAQSSALENALTKAQPVLRLDRSAPTRRLAIRMGRASASLATGRLTQVPLTSYVAVTTSGRATVVRARDPKGVPKSSPSRRRQNCGVVAVRAAGGAPPSSWTVEAAGVSCSVALAIVRKLAFEKTSPTRSLGRHAGMNCTGDTSASYPTIISCIDPATLNLVLGTKQR